MFTLRYSLRPIHYIKCIVNNISVTDAPLMNTFFIVSCRSRWYKLFQRRRKNYHGKYCYRLSVSLRSGSRNLCKTTITGTCIVDHDVSCFVHVYSLFIILTLSFLYYSFTESVCLTKQFLLFNHVAVVISVKLLAITALCYK